MPKKKEKTSQIDEETLRDVLFIADEVSVADQDCREIVTRCCDAAVEKTENAHRDRLEREKAARDIIEGFIHYGQWCYMQRDEGLLHEPQDKVVISAPKRIVADAWSSNAVPIRKIVRRKEDLFPVDTKEATSRTESVRSGQSGLSRKTKGSGMRRRSMDLEGKKPLKNIPDEDAEDKPKIIQLTLSKEEDKESMRRQRRKRGGDSIKESEERDVSAFAIDLGQDKNVKNKQSMSIGLKTGRLSMRSTNAYKYHPNKPYTFDHTGRKMSVTHIKPEKLPNNRVTPTVSFPHDDESDPKGLSSPKQSKNRGGIRKTRKKASKIKPMTEPVSHRIDNVVPVQPPIETICKPAEGVTLKSESGATLKGPELNKKSIANLSRAEYNQYVGTLRANAPKTQVYDTRTKREKKYDRIKHKDPETITRNAEIGGTSLPAVNSATTIPVSTSNLRMSGSPKSIRYRDDRRHSSPKSLKYKRARMSVHTDRMISEHNQHSMLPPLQPQDMNKSSSLEDGYQRDFVDKIASQKIQKSKLGMTMFGDDGK